MAVAIRTVACRPRIRSTVQMPRISPIRALALSGLLVAIRCRRALPHHLPRCCARACGRRSVLVPGDGHEVVHLNGGGVHEDARCATQWLIRAGLLSMIASLRLLLLQTAAGGTSVGRQGGQLRTFSLKMLVRVALVTPHHHPILILGVLSACSWASWSRAGARTTHESLLVAEIMTRALAKPALFPEASGGSSSKSAPGVLSLAVLEVGLFELIGNR